MLPPAPNVDDPDEMTTDPLLPLDALPLRRVRDPDTPEETAFAVSMLKEPLDRIDPKPVDRDTEPPVSWLLPADTASRPATLSSPSPTEILRLPPELAVDWPVERSIDPDRDESDAPVSIVMIPLEVSPLFVKTLKAPLRVIEITP